MSALGLILVTISIDNYNPMAILEDSLDDSELDTAGTVLLKAQQIFSVVNLLGLLKVWNDAIRGFAATVGAIGDKTFLFLSVKTGDTDALTNVISTVAPTFGVAVMLQPH